MTVLLPIFLWYDPYFGRDAYYRAAHSSAYANQKDFLNSGLTLQSALCIDNRPTGSFKGRGDQYILVGQDSALPTAGHQ